MLVKMTQGVHGINGKNKNTRLDDMQNRYSQESDNELKKDLQKKYFMGFSKQSFSDRFHCFICNI